MLKTDPIIYFKYTKVLNDMYQQIWLIAFEQVSFRSKVPELEFANCKIHFFLL